MKINPTHTYRTDVTVRVPAGRGDNPAGGLDRTVRVVVEADLAGLARDLATRAYRSKGKQATVAAGRIVVRVGHHG
jgi:hypothetical protein